MNLRTRCLVGATAAMLAVLGAAARGETAKLELKRLEASDGSKGYSDPMDYALRATSSQSFYRHSQPDGKGGYHVQEDERQTKAFKKIVSKEPEYKSDRPLRGVAKLGTQEFAFALDASTAKTDTPDAEKPKADAEEPKPDSAIAILREKLVKAMQGDKAPPLVPYDRLYFDFNHNGDLTDDKVLSAEVNTGSYSEDNSFARLQFPPLEVTFDAGGTPLDGIFFVSGQMQSSPSSSYMGVSLSAGAYREGEITIADKKRRIILIDFNSNGRFDDETKLHRGSRGPNTPEQMYPEQGDMVLVDPCPPKGNRWESPYDVTSSAYRHAVSKLLNIDGRFYDLKVTPAGDQMTLTPSPVALGSITNPNDGFRALIYSDQGILKVCGNKDTPVPVPEGQWRLLSYTIDVSEAPKPSEASEKDASEKKPTDGSVIASLGNRLKTLLGVEAVGVPERPRYSMVAARATADSKEVKVAKGETVVFPFGPPYKPVVTAPYYGNGQEQVRLELSLIGSTGEICSDMMVNGNRPDKPELTITDDKGKAVQQGSFEYG